VEVIEAAEEAVSEVAVEVIEVAVEVIEVAEEAVVASEEAEAEVDSKFRVGLDLYKIILNTLFIIMCYYLQLHTF